jgi:membrane-associated protein
VASLIDPLIAFVSAHALLAYLTLFLAALLEAVPVVGSVVPGSTIILALSALVPGGELQLQWVLAAAEILTAWPLTSYPHVVAQSEALFRRWGLWAVFFGRFVPPIRAFVPITAGALDMPPSRFFAVNIPAILLWAPAHVLPGVLAISVFEKYGLFHYAGGHPKHYWMPLVVGLSLISGLAVWAFRRRHGGNIIEPAAD